jgi:ABC-type transport system involved in Fe-S cluster assembly fused permease/ATPase subunit
MKQQSFIDMEATFTLFDEEQDIKDAAKPLTVPNGKIEFDNVSFGYSDEYIYRIKFPLMLLN